jgi:hypothetical protein
MAMYSASVVLNDICFCNFEAQLMGHPAKYIIYPVLDFAVLTSFIAVDLFQFPQKSASAYTSNDFFS